MVHVFHVSDLLLVLRVMIVVLRHLQLVLRITWHVGVILILVLEGLSLLVINLHLEELKLLLQSGDLPLRLVLVKGLLRHELAPKVLHLQRELPFDSLVLLPHDVPPNYVELVQNLGNAGLRHLAVESGLQLLDLLNSFSGNPLVGIRHVLVLGFGLADLGLDTESVTDVADALRRQVLGFSHDLNVL